MTRTIPDPDGTDIMDIDSVHGAIEWQARHAEEGGAPGTARVLRGLLALEESDSATARRIFGWQGPPVKDAMPLRINGGLHNLVLTGEDTRLAAVYRGLMTDQGAIDTLVRELVETHDARLMSWLDGPPQTNEAGRSASLMAGLMWLVERGLDRFEMLELGSSAGINTMMERYFFDLGGVMTGPDNSPMRIVPEWRGDQPPATHPQIISIRGCDVAPIDLTAPESALRLKSYVWPEATMRMGRIDAAVRLAQEQAPDVVTMDAASFVEEALARPQEPGVTRTLFHSIVWPYIPDKQQQAVEAAMLAAGAAASEEKPLAWVRLETNRATFRHELHVTYWPGGDEPTLLACAHPHGAWVEWLLD